MDLDTGHATRLERILEADELDAELDRAAISAGLVHQQLMRGPMPRMFACGSEDVWRERQASVAFDISGPMPTSEIELEVLAGGIEHARRCGLRLC